MADQSAEVTWQHGQVPVSRRFDDPYYSVHDGLAEARHVFLAGNDLPARFRPGFHIAELGFGTGLNMLAAWCAWLEAGQAGPLRFTSFEAFPMAAADMATALAAFPEVEELASGLLALWQGAAGQFDLPGLQLEIVGGDARETLPDWDGMSDAWFLDGFAPAKNPELWEPALMQAVASHTRAGGSFATYSAAGHVRRTLEAAGFDVTRPPGFGHKRHMSTGQLR